MDHHPFDVPKVRRPPRNELQGPRPTPLKVQKESHKIRKPPVAPPGLTHQQQAPPPHQPVIIYSISPKVIHANPNDFMTLVQRLTGPGSTSSATLSTYNSISGAVSPAARFASIENTKMPLEFRKSGDVIMEGQEVGISDEVVERKVLFPGILSPGPSSLPPISPNLFSPLLNGPNYGGVFSSINYSSFHHGLLSGGQKHGGSSPFSSGGNFISPSTLISPTSLDFLNHVLNE